MCQGSQTAGPRPRRLFPTHDVGVLIIATGPAVATECVEIEPRTILLAGTLIRVRLPPRIERNRFLEIRSTPVYRHRIARRFLLERGEALLGRGIRAVVEPVIVERESEQLDLRARGRTLGLRHTADDARADQRGQ